MEYLAADSKLCQRSPQNVLVNDMTARDITAQTAHVTTMNVAGNVLADNVYATGNVQADSFTTPGLLPISKTVHVDSVSTGNLTVFNNVQVGASLSAASPAGDLEYVQKLNGVLVHLQYMTPSDGTNTVNVNVPNTLYNNLYILMSGRLNAVGEVHMTFNNNPTLYDYGVTVAHSSGAPSIAQNTFTAGATYIPFGFNLNHSHTVMNIYDYQEGVNYYPQWNAQCREISGSQSYRTEYDGYRAAPENVTSLQFTPTVDWLDVIIRVYARG